MKRFEGGPRDGWEAEKDEVGLRRWETWPLLLLFPFPDTPEGAAVAEGPPREHVYEKDGSRYLYRGVRETL